MYSFCIFLVNSLLQSSGAITEPTGASNFRSVGCLSFVGRKPPGFTIAPTCRSARSCWNGVVVEENVGADYRVEALRLRELEVPENSGEVRQPASQHDVRPHSHRSGGRLMPSPPMIGATQGIEFPSAASTLGPRPRPAKHISPGPRRRPPIRKRTGRSEYRCGQAALQPRRLRQARCQAHCRR